MMVQKSFEFGQVKLANQQSQDAQETTQTKHKTIFDVLAGIAGGSAKTIEALGWWGIPLVAVISALLLGLLSSALSTAGKESSNNVAKVNVKQKSGMLTYDEGNVQQYVGNDGHVYKARETGQIPEGVSLVKSPIATTVNGQPSLVAEKGPELVIGRRTTKRIMMNEPGLLHHLATLERGHRYGGYRGLRTLDEGNLGEAVGSVAVPQQQSGQQLDPETAAALKALPQAMAAFTEMMGAIQERGINATVQQFGKGSLDEGMRSVQNFRKRYPVG